MIVLAFLLGVHRVVTTRVEGVAAGDAAEAFPKSDGEREAAQTFEGVLKFLLSEYSPSFFPFGLSSGIRQVDSKLTSY